LDVGIGTEGYLELGGGGRGGGGGLKPYPL